ncbi:hypothetical protein [Nocardioides soli]|uniref:Uncharacterized protein n=1 Tax=Nocardioides soli TaxID=1036020 RepID=A0A7W4VUV3_9ACTN|nr:hypothetical protein [Nocardioides soli]
MRAVLVPGVLALLPEYASLDDPVSELRAVCLDAVRWLGSDVTVLADDQGARVAAYLLEESGGFEAQAQNAFAPQPPSSVVEVRGAPATSLEPTTRATSYLVVGNGSACRSEKAPGHLDERAHDFDAALGAALASSHRDWPPLDLGETLLGSLDGIRRLREVLPAEYRATVDYDADPFGVQYWVLRWSW